MFQLFLCCFFTRLKLCLAMVIMKKIKISAVDKSIPKKEFDILISTLAKLLIQNKQDSSRINEKNADPKNKI